MRIVTKMNYGHRWVLAVLIFIFFHTGATAQGKDTLFLFTGQILIGELKKIDLGMITFDDDALNYVSIKVTKIKTMSAREHYFRIETTDKQLIYGSVAPDTLPSHVLLVSGLRKTTTSLYSISKLQSYSTTFFDRLEGNFSAGYTFTKSRKIGQVNVSIFLKYTASKNEIELSGSTIGTFDSTSYSRDREDVKLQHYFYFRRSWFTTVLLTYQRNLELSIARRFQEMGGIGNKFIVQDHFQALAITGITLNQEKSIAGESSPVLVEIPAIIKMDFFKFQKPNVQFGTTQSVYFNLTQKGRVRYDGNINLSWELIKDFSINLTFYSNYDNQPPDATANKTDYGIVFGLSYKFNQ